MHATSRENYVSDNEFRIMPLTLKGAAGIHQSSQAANYGNEAARVKNANSAEIIIN